MRRAPAVVLVGMLMAAFTVMLGVGPAHAAPVSGSPFTAPGEHSFVVPAGVTTLLVQVIGGAGGNGGKACVCQNGGPAGVVGAPGAQVTATLPVTAGQTLYVEVGSNGGNGANDLNINNSCYVNERDAGGVGGLNGGGAGGTSTNCWGGGGGGGGYSALRVCPQSGVGCPSSPWLVLAGGGGGGAGGAVGSVAGGGGTPNGGNASHVDFGGGFGATQTAPGAGGVTEGGYSAGNAGSGTTGGTGGDFGGGSGGGGLFGGGGGSVGSGGGGSSYGPANATYGTTANPASVSIDFDNSAPSLKLPATLTATASSPAGATVAYTVTATDPDDATGDLTVNCTSASGSTFPVGDTTVSCTASDPAGNQSSGSFHVIVTDVTAPTLQLPDTITTSATSASGASVAYQVSATDPDNNAGQLRTSCAPAVGGTFPIGDTTVNCTSADPAGNNTAGSFHVVVQDVAPSLTVPSTITANSTGPTGVAVSYTVTASDAIYTPDQLPVNCTTTSGSTFPVGSSTVQCSVTDPAGTTVRASFQVVVNDVTPPMLTLPNTITTSATSASGAPVTYSATATDPDNSSAQLTVACSPPSGGTFPIGGSTVNCSASDPSGNATHGSFKVVVQDVPPVLNLPSTLTVNATGPSGAAVAYTVTAADPIYSAAQLPIVCTPPPASSFSIGTTTVNCRVTDPAGTVVTGSFSVVVNGAARQVTDLTTAVTNLPIQAGLKSSLLTQLKTVQSDLAANQTAKTCSDLTSFINHTKAQSGQGLTTTQANQLLTAAARIQTVERC